MFTDIAIIKAQAGKGGDGLVSFHRTRGNAKGGPDGGDGGKGGSIIVRASHNTSTLSRYRSSKVFGAENGQQGSGNNRHGKNGLDVTLFVPPGTIVKEGTEEIADLVYDGQEAIVCSGGDGGFGNAHFKSSIRQSPNMAELGELGEAKNLTLELKLVADVGLVGLPNAGKSTLLSMVSAAKPEIANYEFTTLVPNLGVVDVDDKSFLLADIPGLIEGASQGKGLGMEFLRHIERCKIIIHLVDVNSPDIVKDYETIRSELRNYDVDLSSIPFIIAITKTETVPEDVVKKAVTTLTKHTKISSKLVHSISAVREMGLISLMREANSLLQELEKKVSKVEETEEIPVIGLNENLGWSVDKDEEKYFVRGEEVERFARRTNYSQSDGLRRLKHILKKKGVYKELRRIGAEEGDTISIASKDFKW